MQVFTVQLMVSTGVRCSSLMTNWMDSSISVKADAPTMLRLGYNY